MKKKLLRPAKFLWRFLSRLLSRSAAQRWLYLPHYVKFHGRLPRNPRLPGAGFEDFVAERVLSPHTAGMGPYVDKEQAKDLARALAPGLRITPTVAVRKLEPRTTLREVEDFLKPFLGKRLAAKPTHGSGTVLLLDRLKAGNLKLFLQEARTNYFFRHGESQYRDLEPKILVEESLAPAGESPPTDYRFHCTRGVPWFGAADAGRFVDLREHHFTVPDYRPVFLQAQGKKPGRTPPRPPRFQEMLRAAARLSRPFEYVRIDLYQTPRGVHFGEFTFTPMAGLFKFLDPAFSQWLLARALQPEKVQPLPARWGTAKGRLARLGD